MNAERIEELKEKVWGAMGLVAGGTFYPEDLADLLALLDEKAEALRVAHDRLYHPRGYVDEGDFYDKPEDEQSAQVQKETKAGATVGETAVEASLRDVILQELPSPGLSPEDERATERMSDAVLCAYAFRLGHTRSTIPSVSEATLDNEDDEAALAHLRSRLSKPAPPQPISEEAQSLMDTTAGGRATADLVSVPPAPGVEERIILLWIDREILMEKQTLSEYGGGEQTSDDLEILLKIRSLILATPAKTVSVTREEVSARVLSYYVDPERAKHPVNKEAIAEVDAFIEWLRDLGIAVEGGGK